MPVKQAITLFGVAELVGFLEVSDQAGVARRWSLSSTRLQVCTSWQKLFEPGTDFPRVLHPRRDCI